IVGRSVTALFGVTFPTADIQELEAQAKEANCGLEVYLRDKVSGLFVERGYWFKAVGDTAATNNWRNKQVGGASEVALTALLAKVTAAGAGSLAVFRATPLGSERRIASFTQSSSDSPGTGDPSGIFMVGTSPDTLYDPVVLLTRNWVPGTGTNDFNWT